jgi:hypothetical protein
MIRETVQVVIEARPAFPGAQRLLRRARMVGGWWEWSWFEWAFYDPESYELADESVLAQRDLAPYRVRRMFSKKRRLAVQASYDTSEGVELAEHMACSVCGGKTARSSCKDPKGHKALTVEARENRLSEYLTARVLLHAAAISEAAAEDELGVLLALERGA